MKPEIELIERVSAGDVPSGAAEWLCVTGKRESGGIQVVGRSPLAFRRSHLAADQVGPGR